MSEKKRKARVAKVAPIYIRGGVNTKCRYLHSRLDRRSGIRLYYCKCPAMVRHWERELKETHEEIMRCCTEKRKEKTLKGIEDV